MARDSNETSYLEIHVRIYRNAQNCVLLVVSMVRTWCYVDVLVPHVEGFSQVAHDCRECTASRASER